MTAHTMLDAALAYAAKPLAVLPCAVRSKEPAIARGCHAATSNPATIRRHWLVPDRNPAIASGAISGVWVVDVDGEEGAASLAALEAKHGELPATWVSSTGRGFHFWFKYVGPVSNSAGRIAAAIDVRGDGGYAIAPPSVHPTGRTYAWLTPPDGEPAIAPPWLLALARKRPPPSISERAQANIRRPNAAAGAYGAAALDRECAALANVGPGGRNGALNLAAFRLAQLVAGGELDRQCVVDRLVAACEQNGLLKDDGLRSVLGTLYSGANAGIRHPRSRGGAA